MGRGFGQTFGLVAFGDKDASILKRCATRCWLLAQETSARRASFYTAFAPNAFYRAHCHELRIIDRDDAWRIVYRIGADAIVIADVVSKKNERTKEQTIERCKLRLTSL